MSRHKPRLRIQWVLSLLLVIGLVTTFNVINPGRVSEAQITSPVTFTILHTNDFHGNLLPEGSNPGAAKLYSAIKSIRTAKGAENVLLVDAGDTMQGTLLSNVQQGYPVVDCFNQMGYDVAALGNHDFEWGQDALSARNAQADFELVAANIVTGDSEGWEAPEWAVPYVIETIGTVPNQVSVALIGVTTMETAVLNPIDTVGLTFKDPAEAILHYYDDMDAAADVIVVLSHLGYYDGGYGYTYDFEAYGDMTLAQRLKDAGKPVHLIIGGHSHTDLAAPGVVGSTKVVQAHYNGRKLGQADITVQTNGSVSISWLKHTVTSYTPDSGISTLVNAYNTDSNYLELINQVIGWSGVDITRSYDGDSLMGAFLNDALYNALNTDTEPLNDVDIVLNNAGGFRTDFISADKPFPITYGMMFNLMPFGNSLVTGELTGAEILDLMNQSATLNRGALQASGLRYGFYNYNHDSDDELLPWAWGAMDVMVKDRSSLEYEPLELLRTYKVATNEFLAPSGGDNFNAFKYMKNIMYWGDMLDIANQGITAMYPVENPYNGVLDGRITRDGDSLGGSIIPVTILHHNDAHGHLVKEGSVDGYTQLASLIKTIRADNPARTLVLNAGDNLQGDRMMFYYRFASLGIDANGNTLPLALNTNPMIAAMNAVGYDAATVGEHDFDFGSSVFVPAFSQANFPILAANVSDTGTYGLSAVPVEPFVTKSLDGIDVAIIGITNPRTPEGQLPGRVEGLEFQAALETTQGFVTQLRNDNDIVLALTHLGFTESEDNPEVQDVDTVMAETVAGLDAILGGHSHTQPGSGAGNYKYLPAAIAGPENTPVLVGQAYRYNSVLGEMVLGLRANSGGGYDVISRAGRWHDVTASTPEDSAIKGLLDPYVTQFNAYVNAGIGQTIVPILGASGFTEETNAANLEADAAVFKLRDAGIPADFFLGGANSNRNIAVTASQMMPVTLKVSDLYTLLPYDNALVVLDLNGPQLKAILERSFRNYYFYKYVPGYGGYEYYALGNLGISADGQITYKDTYPESYDETENHVLSLTISGQAVDFEDASTYYKVATVDFLAMGGVNFNDGGVSLWPLNQIESETQFYIRDAVQGYIQTRAVISPMVEGRLQFLNDTTPPSVTIEVPQMNNALQDGVTFVATASDDVSVDEVSFTIRNPGDPEGTVINEEFEGMAATFDNDSERWVLDFDTLRLEDGDYLMLARAVDTSSNDAWAEPVPFSIRNWATVTLLPASEKYKAGRTVPIKFSIRVIPEVDPDEAFVYNEQLTIKLYETGKPGTTLQVSTFGLKSTDYRIDPSGFYVTNFATSKKPMSYTVDIIRTETNYLVGTFNFVTTK